MRTLTILAVALTLSLAIAGCATKTTPTPTTTTATTTTTTTTTTTPTVTTPTVTTPALGAVTGITVTSFPANATAQSNATVCWRVDGTGNVQHTAVHFDNATQNATNTTFMDYSGTMYPNNASAPAAAGYTLPGNFCTNIPVGDGVYFRAHVIDVTGGNGRLSDEREIEVS